jgi:hypothetical protein
LKLFSHQGHRFTIVAKVWENESGGDGRDLISWNG